MKISEVLPILLIEQFTSATADKMRNKLLGPLSDSLQNVTRRTDHMDLSISLTVPKLMRTLGGSIAKGKQKPSAAIHVISPLMTFKR